MLAPFCEDWFWVIAPSYAILVLKETFRWRRNLKAAMGISARIDTLVVILLDGLWHVIGEHIACEAPISNGHL